jgi:hypothetical protein
MHLDSLVVGQRYKIHYKKGFNVGDREGKDPNRYFFVGTLSEARPGRYAGTTEFVFTDVTYMNGTTAPQHTVHDYAFFGEMSTLVAAPFTNNEGGRRRRRNTRKRNTRRRRNTRRHRA